jgi:Trypsin-like peptidase domain
MTKLAPKITLYTVNCFLSFALMTVRVPAQIPSNVLLRTFRISEDNPDTTPNYSYGTAFTIDVDQRQYLVTAKHLVAAMKDEGIVRIQKGINWVPLSVKVFRCEGEIDIAVLVPEQQLSVSFELPANADGVQLGQDIYFAGFPYGYSSVTDAKSSLPFIKKGIWSRMVRTSDASIYYLEGHDNPGFSGGPVVFRDFRKSTYTFNVLGVISGYESEYSPVMRLVPIKDSEIKPEDIARNRITKKDSQSYRLDDTGDVVEQDTGIVKAYNIVHAVDLIKKHPSGPLVSDSFTEWPKNKE